MLQKLLSRYQSVTLSPPPILENNAQPEENFPPRTIYHLWKNSLKITDTLIFSDTCQGALPTSPGSSLPPSSPPPPPPPPYPQPPRCFNQGDFSQHCNPELIIPPSSGWPIPTFSWTMQHQSQKQPNPILILRSFPPTHCHNQCQDQSTFVSSIGNRE